MANKVCPICEGKKFIKVKEVNEMGFEYEIFKRCDCMKRKTKVEDKTRSEWRGMMEKKHGHNFAEHTGERFGRWTVLEYVGDRKWKCRCDCGSEKSVHILNLLSGRSKSCGCYNSEKCAETHYKHGKTHKRIYRIWAGMKDRCSNSNVPLYAYYGGRGITVCDEWLNDFSAFYDWAMNNGYSDMLSIDRIDNSKGYSPDNCRWVDRKTQCRNRRTNRYLHYNGQRKTIAEWSELLRIPYATIHKRLENGWSVGEALSIKKYGRRNTHGIEDSTL